jgi:hypothetical protein
VGAGGRHLGLVFDGFGVVDENWYVGAVEQSEGPMQDVGLEL